MASRVSIVAEAGSFRTVHCHGRGYAVIEMRDGCVYSVDPHHTRCAPDNAAGIHCVVAETGWMSKPDARRQFNNLVSAGQRLARKIW